MFLVAGYVSVAFIHLTDECIEIKTERAFPFTCKFQLEIRSECFMFVHTFQLFVLLLINT